MAATVAVVQTTAAGSGAGVALDRIGTTDYQYVKLAAGQTSQATPIEGTTGVPAAAAGGLVVRLVDGPAVTITNTVPVQVSGVVPVVTQASVSITGLPVWWNPTATVVISPTVLTVNTAATVAGASVTAQVSGPVSISNVAPVTTQASASVTGLPVWWHPTAVVAITPTVLTVNTAATIAGASVTIQQGASVTAAVTGNVTVAGSVALSGTGLVSVVPGLSVTIQNGASVAAVVSGPVSVSNITPVTTQASASVTGLPVWWNPTASVVISPTVLTVNTAGTVAGASVTIQNGASVSAVVSGTVTVTPTTFTVNTAATVAGASVTVAGNLTVVSTVGTVLGTVNVNVVAGGSQTTVVSGTVAALDVGRTQVVIVVTSTSVGINGTLMLFTVYTGAQQAVAGTSGYVIPAGKTFRILGQALVAGNSVTTSPVTHRLFVCPTTGAPTWTSTMPVAAAVALVATSAGIGYSAADWQVADVAAGATLALAHTIGTSGGSIVQGVVKGYLFP